MDQGQKTRGEKQLLLLALQYLKKTCKLYCQAVTRETGRGSSSHTRFGGTYKLGLLVRGRLSRPSVTQGGLQLEGISGMEKEKETTGKEGNEEQG